VFPNKENCVRSLSVRLFLLIGALSLGVGAFPQPNAASASSMRVAQMEQIDQFRIQTWRWQSLMHKPKTPTSYRERRSDDEKSLERLRDLWRARARTAEYQAEHPPHRGAWLCIHRYERNPTQGWSTRTGNGYYGGLQMDINFQRAYGPELLRRKGTADRWTAVEQMWVAERAHRSGRGFYPWPNTARYCGLI
jgi:Transglycosylase-like domain